MRLEIPWLLTDRVHIRDLQERARLMERLSRISELLSEAVVGPVITSVQTQCLGDVSFRNGEFYQSGRFHGRLDDLLEWESQKLLGGEESEEVIEW